MSKQVKSGFVPGKNYYLVHHSVSKKRGNGMQVMASKAQCMHAVVTNVKGKIVESALFVPNKGNTYVSSQFYHAFESAIDAVEFIKSEIIKEPHGELG